MKIDVLTLFPQMFQALNESIIGKAQERGLLSVNLINIRDYSLDKNKRCDDYSYGGGAGMLMSTQPLFDAINSVKGKDSHVIYLSPKGTLLNQDKVIELSRMDKDLILVCGHYEGIDERIIEMCIDEEISVGDYILTGGELPAMILIDAVARYIPGVLGNSETTTVESFSNMLLEYPQYTRPAVFNGLSVPEILLSGNHEEVDKWRLEKSIEITRQRRPDLYEKYMKNSEKT